MQRDRGVSADSGAENLAVGGLTFLAQDAERLGRFLALMGIDPGEIRTIARERSFLAAVLDHICADDRRLLAFAEEMKVAPHAITRAQASLSGPAWERETP